MSAASATTASARVGAWISWWQWDRAHARLQQWVRTLIDDRPYTIRFATGTGSFVNFSTREIVVEPAFSTALSTAARQIPTTWGASWIVRQSTLDVLCARALAYHEGSHVLWTAVVPLDSSTHGWLVNALEDERIERLTAAYYAPAARDFAELGRRMWLDGWKASSDRTTMLLNACLYTRWDHERPPGTATRLVISDPADAALWQDQIVPLVERAWCAPNTAAVATIAREILTLIGLPLDDATARHGNAERELLGGIVLDVRGERHADDQPLDDGVIQILDGVPGAGDDDPDATDERLASRAADSDPSAGQLWMQPYQALQASVMGAVRRLTRELHAAAPEAEPVASNRRGRFDQRACMRSKGKTPVVREQDDADDPRGLSIVLLIDGTSSMGGSPGAIAADGGPANHASFQSGRMPAVRQAALLFERACAALQVPLTIGFARDHAYPIHIGPFRQIVLPEPVIWIKRWETPANAEGPRAMLAGMYGDATCEAVSRSLILAQRELDRRSEAVKLVIYLHDGRPEDETPEEVTATIDRLRRTHGTVIIGLFVGDQGNLAAMQTIFGRAFTIGVDNLQHLPQRLGRVLAKYRQTS